MQLKSLVRGSYDCTRTVFILLAILGAAALGGGCVLVAKGHFAIDYITSEELYFARGVGLVILGILFLVWSAVLTGCTVFLRRIHKDELNELETQWNPIVIRSLSCTMISSSLLAIAGVALVITGMVNLLDYPLPYPNFYYLPSSYRKGAKNYIGGAMLTVLAAIFFIWSAILAACAFCLRRTSQSGLNEPSANDPPAYETALNVLEKANEQI